MEQELSLKELLNIIKKRIGLIINFALIGLLVTSFFTFFLTTPEYSSTTQLLVNRTQQSDIIQRSDIDTNVQLINTYKDIIKGPVILDVVREELNLNLMHIDLSNKINITSETNSQVFSIRVTDANPFNAAEIANTTASVFRDNLNEIMNVDNVTIISQANPNLDPISPNHSLNISVGLVFASLFGVGFSFLLEMLDTTVKDEKFIVEELEWTSLGIISEMTPEELQSDIRQSYNESKLNPKTARTRL